MQSMGTRKKKKSGSIKMLDKPKLDRYKQEVATHFNRRINYDSSDLAFRRALGLVELVPLQKGQSILDIATGTGIVAISAAEIFGDEGNVIGVDIADVLLDQAWQKIEAAGLKNIELIEADAEYLDFAENSFDAIFCSSAIVLFNDIPAVLRNWYRFLKPGGFVAFHAFLETGMMTPEIMRACAKCGISLPNIHDLLGTAQKCEKILQQAGFVDIKVESKQFGKYLSLDDAKKWWNGTWLHPQNPLRQLSEIEIEMIIAEYAKEVEGLVTAKGVWQDMTIFFVVGGKG
jgi:ubiquinone/menaquinone biosynthesis C-methylase UbiE